MWARPFQKSDVEAGARPLYPMMLESPELRWAFIRKIYSILTVQLLVTIAVAATVVSVHPIALFFVSSGAGLALYIVLIITPFIGMFTVTFSVILFFNLFFGSTFDFLLWLFFFLVSVMSLVLLPPEAPGELRITWDFYRLTCLCGWIDLCIYQW